jgi:hypothetical protein
MDLSPIEKLLSAKGTLCHTSRNYQHSEEEESIITLSTWFETGFEKGIIHQLPVLSIQGQHLEENRHSSDIIPHSVTESFLYFTSDITLLNL